MDPSDTTPPSRQKKRPFETTSAPTSSTTPTPERMRVTQACDRCRQRKTVCDTQRPACVRCLQANHECTFMIPQKKRGPLYGSKQGVKSQPSTTIGQLSSSFTTAATTIADTTLSDKNSRLRKTWESHVQELEQRLWQNPSLDPFSTEVQDHLVEVFFEFCFEDFNCFSPARFLKSYSQGTLSPSLLNAACAVAARFSNHPAVVATPPCMSGEPFASRIRSRMGELVVEVTIDTVHTLMLLGFYEYISGNHLRGYRFEGIAGGIALELELHKTFSQKVTGPLTSEERVTTEVKVRTFAFLLGSDTANSAVGGIPPLFDSTQFEPWIVSYEADWWVESPPARPVGVQEEQSMDPAYVSILHKTLRPRPIRGFGDPSLTVPILQVGISVWRFTNTGKVPAVVSAQPSQTAFRSSPSSPTTTTTPLTSPTPTTQQNHSSMTSSRWRDSIPILQKFDAAAETWRRQLPEGCIPTNAKSSIWQTDMNVIHHTLYYYITQISIYRPVLVKAGMATEEGDRRKKGQLGQDDATGESGRTTDVNSGVTDEDEVIVAEDQKFLRMALDICSNAANEITVIVEQFTERLVKIRGAHLSFPVFIAGTAHVLQLTTSKDPSRVALAKQGLFSCIRFFRMLGPYWSASNDQAMFLEDLLNTYTAKTEQQPSIAKVRHMESTEEKTILKNQQDLGDKSPDPAISAALALLEMKTPGTSQHHPSGRIRSKGVPNTMPSPMETTATKGISNSPTNSSRSSISTKSASTTTRFRSESEESDGGLVSAFLITDSGLGTIWREPENLEALEKATLLSLERLSFLN